MMIGRPWLTGGLALLLAGSMLSVVWAAEPKPIVVPHPQTRPLSAPIKTERPGWPRIMATGEIRAGVPADALPFGLRLSNGQFVGLTVDLLHEIARTASADLGKTLTLTVLPTGREGGMRLIAEGKLDIACGLERPEQVLQAGLDPTFPYFLARTIVLARPEAAKSGFWGLAAQTVAVPGHLEIASMLETLMPGIQLQRTASTVDALSAFHQGRVQAVAGLAEQLLEARSMMTDGQGLEVMPGYRDLTREPIVCMVPPNQSHWREVTDRTLYSLLAGFDRNEGRYRQLYDRWVGPNSPVDEQADTQLLRFMGRLRALPQ